MGNGRAVRWPAQSDKIWLALTAEVDAAVREGLKQLLKAPRRLSASLCWAIGSDLERPKSLFCFHFALFQGCSFIPTLLHVRLV